MENYSVYQDIANRTGGDIYIGVVGPVRTGKSTFIRKFMEKLVLPLAKENERGEIIDEMPQAAAGRTVMTTEPKFVPAKAAHITVAKGAEAAVRLIDCVGFAVEGASGFEEDGQPRLVKTPWKAQPMPFEEAARLGTEKVIQEHSTIGILVTTDGSITDIPRENYVAAEERAVSKLKALNKPFVVVLNCKNPHAVQGLKEELEIKYGVPMVAINVEEMSEEDVTGVLQKALFEFPVSCIDVRVSPWVQSLPEEHFAVQTLVEKIKTLAPKIVRMRDCDLLESLFEEDEDYLNPVELYMDLGRGRVEITVRAKEELYYRVIAAECGEEISDEFALMQYVRATAGIKRAYGKLQSAVEDAEKNGYGIAYPCEEDYRLEKPELVKKNAGYGVRFTTKATGYHIVRIDIDGDVTPIIGTKEQSEEFIASTLQSYEEGEEKVWQTNIFGKSLKDLALAELSGKANAMPVEIRKRLRRAANKIVNEGKGNMICFVF